MRSCCATHLRTRWPDARIIHELPLRYATRSIDLAAVMREKIVAVEIKSSRDTTDRLEAQLRGFAPICWRIYVALAPCWNEELPAESVPTKKGTAYRRRFTEAQLVIEAVRREAPWIESWTVAPDAPEPIRLTSTEWAENRHPWLAKMLEMLHVAELDRICFEHRVGPRSSHVRTCDVLLDALRASEIVRACCAALRARDAFCAGTDAPIRTGAPAPKQEALL